MMRDQDFCSELSDLFKNFSTFCFNHNDFSRLNDNIMRTLLESFACNFTLGSLSISVMLAVNR